MCDESKERRISGRRCDNCLRRDVSQALRTSGRAGLHHLCVTARDGHIQLQGELPSFYEKQLAQQIAMTIPGVDRVFNEAAVRTHRVRMRRIDRRRSA